MHGAYCATVGGLIALGLAVTGCSGGSLDEGLSHIVKAKLEETQAIERRERARNIHGSYTSKRSRSESERDSGVNETLMFMNNAYLRTFGKIGYQAEKLVVSARPRASGAPVIIDDPQSFDLVVLSGRVIVSGEALSELMNVHVFNFEGSPLRNVRVETKPDVLVLSGEMHRRGKWAPFSMEGALSISEGVALALTPTKTVISGQAANALLEAANVDLDELISLRAPGVLLTKSTIYLRPGEMFPPPALGLTLKSVKVEERGLVLEAEGARVPAFPELLTPSDSFIVMRGGDAKFMNMMSVNVFTQIMSSTPGKPLDFCLYDYRKQIAAGRLKFTQEGGVLVYVKNYNELKVGDATR